MAEALLAALNAKKAAPNVAHMRIDPPRPPVVQSALIAPLNLVDRELDFSYSPQPPQRQPPRLHLPPHPHLPPRQAAPAGDDSLAAEPEPAPRQAPAALPTPSDPPQARGKAHPPQRFRAAIAQRPTSLASAIDVFSAGGVDTLLGVMYDAESHEAAVSTEASRATNIRRFLVTLLALLSAAACIVNAAPLCDRKSEECVANLSLCGAVLNAIGVATLFLLEKTTARNNAPRLRDLAGEFASLVGEVRSAIYHVPPAADSASAFIRSATSRAEELKMRASGVGVRLRPNRPRQTV